MKTKELVENVLNELATLEGHQYKSRAYKHAYEEIANMNIEEFDSRTSFIDIFGIGKGINDKINEVRTTGTCKRLLELRDESSELLSPQLYKVRKSFITKRIPLELAMNYVDRLFKVCNEYFPNVEFNVAGSVRRKKALIADIDLVATCTLDEFREVCGRLADYYSWLLKKENVVISRGEYKMSFLIDDVNKIEVDLIHATKEDHAFQMLYLTGSKEHNIKMRAIAKAKGYLLNQKGIFINGERVSRTFDTDKDIFNFLRIPYVEPENR